MAEHGLWRGSAVVELRRYTLVPGRREELIELFERELLEPQEAVGMRVLGQFRCPTRPDAFIWLRGFRDMASRPSQLTDFYDGPVWAEHREAANATMVDSDDVLLLKPVYGDAVHPLDASTVGYDGALTLAIQRVESVSPTHLAEALDASRACLRSRGLIAAFVSESAPNNFAALPVRDDGPFVVSLSRADTPGRQAWADLSPVGPECGEPELLELEPTDITRRRIEDWLDGLRPSSA